MFRIDKQMSGYSNSKRKIIILIFGFCVALHFSLSIISGTKVGHASSNLLGDRSKAPKDVIENPDLFKKWLEEETKNAISFWYPVYIFSNRYPIGWILTPMTKKIGRDILNKYLDDHSLNLEQFKFRMWAIALAKTLINSFFFGFCLFFVWYLVCATKKNITKRWS